MPTKLPRITAYIGSNPVLRPNISIAPKPPAQKRIAPMKVVFLNAAAGSLPFFSTVIEKIPIIEAM